MANTPNFGIEKPSLGSYYGGWHHPLNANMDLVDELLHTLKTHNKKYSQVSESVAEEGVTWYDTLEKTLFITTNEGKVALMSSANFILTLVQQHQLVDGPYSVIDLHAHPGYSTHFFKVRNPELASSSNDLADKQYFAVPWDLFDTNRTTTNNRLTAIEGAASQDSAKLNGITSDGVNLHVGNIDASGYVRANSLRANAGTSNGTITIGGGSSSISNEITVSDVLPIDIVSSSATTGLELRVQGSKVWMQSNQGQGSGMNSDKVDGRDVDDDIATVNNLWTAAKTKSVVTTDITSALPDATVNDSLHLGGVEAALYALKVDVEPASATNRGTVKIGAGITADAGGSISTSMASPTVLGSIKIGGGLEIDGNGIATTLIKNVNYDGSKIFKTKAYDTVTVGGAQTMAPAKDVTMGYTLKLIFGNTTVYMPATENSDMAYCSCTCTCVCPCPCTCPSPCNCDCCQGMCF
jgi:hypothetical protein